MTRPGHDRRREPKGQQHRTHPSAPSGPAPAPASACASGPIAATPIPFSTAYWDKMLAMISPVDKLKQQGYRVCPFDEKELLGLRRCRNCRVRIRSKKDDPEKKKKREQRKEQREKEALELKVDDIDESGEQTVLKGDAEAQPREAESEDVLRQKALGATITAIEVETSGLGFDDQSSGAIDSEQAERDDDKATAVKDTTEADVPAEESKDKKEESKKEKPEKPKKVAVCQYHTGKVFEKHFTCCQAHVSTLGCTTADKHAPIESRPGELLKRWMLHQTPRGSKTRSSQRKAIAMDCEMGTSFSGESEAIRLSAIDYFTGEVLIDSLIYPSVPMLHLNTRYSGVTRSMLETARRKRTCFIGRDQARRQLWNFVGPETVVVVHGGQSDFLTLRWIHRRVIDTCSVGAALGNRAEKRSLKHLAEALLQRKIQTGPKGHDSLEDASACRDVLHWYMENGDSAAQVVDRSVEKTTPENVAMVPEIAC